jgi:3-hexulose-6-phosphate synthase
MSQPLIQMALDSLDFDATMELAKQVAPHVDIFEVGTPCIKFNGLKIVQALRTNFPDHKILVDLKTMDAGEYEAAPFFEAGADICTVLGVSGVATIAGVVKAAKTHGGEVRVDLINVPNKPQCAAEAVEAGAHIIGVHTGLDAQAAGQTPFSDLQEIAALGQDVKISVAGGIKAATARQVVDAGATIVVAGAAIYGADSPAEAAREIRESVTAAGV